MEEARTKLVQTEAHNVSPMAATEAILITGVIKAKQIRDIMTLDIPIAFVQKPIPKDCDKVMMKLKDHWLTFFVKFIQVCMTTLCSMKENRSKKCCM